MDEDLTYSFDSGDQSSEDEVLLDFDDVAHKLAKSTAEYLAEEDYVNAGRLLSNGWSVYTAEDLLQNRELVFVAKEHLEKAFEVLDKLGCSSDEIESELNGLYFLRDEDNAGHLTLQFSEDNTFGTYRFTSQLKTIRIVPKELPGRVRDMLELAEKELRRTGNSIPELCRSHGRRMARRLGRSADDEALSAIQGETSAVAKLWEKVDWEAVIPDLVERLQMPFTNSVLSLFDNDSLRQYVSELPSEDYVSLLSTINVQTHFVVEFSQKTDRSPTQSMQQQSASWDSAVSSRGDSSTDGMGMVRTIPRFFAHENDVTFRLHSTDTVLSYIFEPLSDRSSSQPGLHSKVYAMTDFLDMSDQKYIKR